MLFRFAQELGVHLPPYRQWGNLLQFSPVLGWRQGWWSPAQCPWQGGRAGWVLQQGAVPWQWHMSFWEHWDSDSTPVPILCHTVRWE